MGKYYAEMESYRKPIRANETYLVARFSDGLVMGHLIFDNKVSQYLRTFRTRSIGTIYQHCYVEIYQQTNMSWELIEVWNG